ncbi:enoyl-CoA hydratase/isomerase family protein [Rhodococcus koreensis]
MSSAEVSSMSDNQTILVEDHGPWAVVTFNRPEKRNAFNDAMKRRIMEIYDELIDKRVVVLTGAGAAFCAGVDLAEIQQKRRERPELPQPGRSPSGKLNPWFEVHEQLRHHPAIFIAAVNGYALGGGSTFINNCELAIAAETATIGTPEIGFGELPHPAAAAMVTRILPKHAAEIIFMAKRVDAATAYRMGMVNEVVPDDQLLTRATEIATHIAKFDDVLLDWAKKCLRGMVNASWDDAMELGRYVASSINANRREAEGFTMGDFVAGGRSSGQGA